MAIPIKTWECPLCSREDGKIAGVSDADILIKAALHIREHERRAALKAVDVARVGCAETACQLGRTQVWNIRGGFWEPRLSEYDRAWLAEAKVYWPI